MDTRSDLIEKLRNREYRQAFVSSQINIGIPYQIRALRGEMRQEELAASTGMKQPRISAIERPGYSSLNLTTLKRIAAAFDVALIVRFVPFSELVEWAENFSSDTFVVPAFKHDNKLFQGSALSEVTANVEVEKKAERKAVASIQPY